MVRELLRLGPPGDIHPSLLERRVAPKGAVVRRWIRGGGGGGGGGGGAGAGAGGACQPACLPAFFLPSFLPSLPAV